MGMGGRFRTRLWVLWRRTQSLGDMFSSRGTGRSEREAAVARLRAVEWISGPDSVEAEEERLRSGVVPMAPASPLLDSPSRRGQRRTRRIEMWKARRTLRKRMKRAGRFDSGAPVVGRVGGRVKRTRMPVGSRARLRAGRYGQRIRKVDGGRKEGSRGDQ